MNELNEAWSEMLKTAIESAKRSGRHDVAEYLELKAANDVIRTVGTSWLLESAIQTASSGKYDKLGVTVDRTDPHNFTHLGARLVGYRLNVRLGVRCFTIEAGWTRTPGDGFMRGGAMAIAKLTHFGLPKQSSVLHLVATEAFPVWRHSDATSEQPPFSIEELNRHFQLLVG